MDCEPTHSHWGSCISEGLGSSMALWGFVIVVASGFALTGLPVCMCEHKCACGTVPVRKSEDSPRVSESSPPASYETKYLVHYGVRQANLSLSFQRAVPTSRSWHRKYRCALLHLVLRGFCGAKLMTSHVCSQAFYPLTMPPALSSFVNTPGQWCGEHCAPADRPHVT